MAGPFCDGALEWLESIEPDEFVTFPFSRVVLPLVTDNLQDITIEEYVIGPDQGLKPKIIKVHDNEYEKNQDKSHLSL